MAGSDHTGHWLATPQDDNLSLSAVALIAFEAADGAMREVGRDEKVVWWLHAAAPT
jgi:hypothetical protein